MCRLRRTDTRADVVLCWQVYRVSAETFLHCGLAGGAEYLLSRSVRYCRSDCGATEWSGARIAAYRFP
jgi:hypothetical protein